MTEAAFFDLDKTIIAGSSTLAFGKPLHRAGFLGKGHLVRLGIDNVIATKIRTDGLGRLCA